MCIAGVLSRLTFGFFIDRTGNWTLPFLLSIAMLVDGILVSFWMHPERPLPSGDEPELDPVTTTA